MSVNTQRGGHAQLVGSPRRLWPLLPVLAVAASGFLVFRANSEIITGLPLLVAINLFLFLTFAGICLFVLGLASSIFSRALVLQVGRKTRRALLAVSFLLGFFLLQYVAFSYLFMPSFDLQGHRVSYVRLPYALLKGREPVARIVMEPVRSLAYSSARQNGWIASEVRAAMSRSARDQRFVFVVMAVANTMFWFTGLVVAAAFGRLLWRLAGQQGLWSLRKLPK